MSEFVVTNIDDVMVRPYEPDDEGAVRRLYEDGRLAGDVQANDTAADIDNIDEAYVFPQRSAIWIGEYAGQVVGMVAVAEEETDVAEIRRLRVKPELTDVSPVAQKLVETALSFCRHHNYLKVVLDTRMSKAAALEVFEKFAFQHTRTRVIHGKDVLEFYIDLYREVDEGDTSGIF